MIGVFTSGFGIWEWIMVIFAIVSLLLIIPFAIFDTLKSKNLSTSQKFLWIIFILIAPYLGAVVYLFWGRKQKAL
ncbi:PLDc N-terminal domain-containing protein [Daejeonella sp.]|uniref:PLDc N-terminal domain-containing protein n=1 Tax=Daejeonella sp. TaxID=2805397 RepID=UPI002717C32D|nr:PLDc N-terminal domain-containing protein [Daejeonella sp.]MDO8991545.1 PLDc N-terminal domain-containing protein [Daejeonella sp.]MDP2415519.1 PLDc N-terminal domain-containing protein [Daejeonella sp.]